ncbi:hypothetical protein KIN20_033323 [Parelaphostrongylus tenuis]|uniref:Uncharacterized protein n=1 Tax=Parelaphostrongylus tenuis TaxID=148309 RepID=A0AAD5R7V3_PARTN|nr:hypothetical protein KIN20_033323 [Parelaphostrongylus tenuis]
MITKMAKLPINFFMISLLATVSRVLGCGVVPAGQASTRTFTVRGFTTLPVTMVYTGKPEISTKVSGIAHDRVEAQGFVQRLVEQTVFGVLERQGRRAFLSEAVISNILGQLNVRVNYEPMRCQTVLDGPADRNVNLDDKQPQNYIIVSNAVTAVCPKVDDRQRICMMGKNVAVPIPTNHTSILGTLITANIIMANWSRQMWLNRAVRILASGPFGTHFFSATATVGGN